MMTEYETHATQQMQQEHVVRELNLFMQQVQQEQFEQEQLRMQEFAITCCVNNW